MPVKTRWKRTGGTIGAGGQAQILVVIDQSGELEGEFAMKVLTNRSRIDRLDLEISTTKSLYRGGARVLPILYDYTTGELGPKERPWFITPIIEGGSLADTLVPGRPWNDDPIEGRWCMAPGSAASLW